MEQIKQLFDENIISKMAAILYRPRCDNTQFTLQRHMYTQINNETPHLSVYKYHIQQ